MKLLSAMLDPGLAHMRKELEAGLGGAFDTDTPKKGRVSIVEGPLIRATHGGLGHTHMPLSLSSTYAPLHRYFDEVYKRANTSYDPDPELDLQGREHPKFGNHSDRRCADTVARQTRAETCATIEDIDIVFGWKEKIYSKDMHVTMKAPSTGSGAAWSQQ